MTLLFRSVRRSHAAGTGSGSSAPVSFPGLVGKRVLVVEDETVTRMLLQFLLRQAHLSIVGETDNGLDAVAMALRERPELILMDINIPRLDGLEAARRIRAVYPARILFLTAYTEPVFQQQANQLGACAYLQKPIDAGLLLPALERACAGVPTPTAPVVPVQDEA